MSFQHAVWRVIAEERFKEPCLEPYYDTEPLSELGFSFTQSVGLSRPHLVSRNTDSVYRYSEENQQL